MGSSVATSRVLMTQTSAPADLRVAALTFEPDAPRGLLNSAGLGSGGQSPAGQGWAGQGRGVRSRWIRVRRVSVRRFRVRRIRVRRVRVRRGSVRRFRVRRFRSRRVRGLGVWRRRVRRRRVSTPGGQGSAVRIPPVFCLGSRGRGDMVALDHGCRCSTAPLASHELGAALLVARPTNQDLDVAWSRSAVRGLRRCSALPMPTGSGLRADRAAPLPVAQN